MPMEKPLLQCYNRGCGQKYDPDSNNEDSCRHHPGQPIFHDAYKGWGCCNKKCTDFTEFLNIKGCTVSKHSNIKPPEPEKPLVKDVPDTEVIEVKPIPRTTLQRPSFNTPLVTMKPQIAPTLQQQVSPTEPNPEENSTSYSNEITIGTNCKNGGCNVTYQGPVTDETICTYHPGIPIFHEGMKYWSCCQRKTSDFNAFLNQAGCERGHHVWKKDNDDKKLVRCRWDYHQTASHVVVSIYAKQYSPTESVIKLNPVHLVACLIFPQQSNGTFLLDIELKGIVNVEASQVSMFGTKVEIKLKKAEPGSWSTLGELVKSETVAEKKSATVEKITPQIEAVDLDDL